MQRISFFAMTCNFKELCSEGTNSGSNQSDKFFWHSNKSKFNSCLPEGLQQAGIAVHSLPLL
jgi:hypothetical protein